MKTTKVTFAMFVPVLALLCLAGAGCGGGGPSNCVTVDAGRPFVAQEGLRYGISEGGPTFQFHQGYSSAQVVYVDPDRYYNLQPGGAYVLLMDLTYPARAAESDREFDEAMDNIQKTTEMNRRMTDDFTRSMRESSDRMLDSVRGMNRTNSETLGIIDNATRQQRK